MNFRPTVARLVPLLVLASLVFSDQSAAARVEDDPFAGPVLDGCRWDDWSTAGGRAVSNGALTLTTSATSAPSSATVYSQYRLRGDFTYDVAVSASGAWAATIPSTDRVLAYLGFYVENGTRFFIALSKNGTQPQIIVFSQSSGTAGDLVQIPVGASNARLRIVRSAKVLTFQFDVGNGWQMAASVANIGEDGLVSIGANTSGTPRQLVAAFSNFALASGTSTFRPYVAQAVLPRAEFHAGVTVADYLAKRIWGPHYAVIDPLTPLAANGVGWVRAGVTTTSEPSLGTTPVEKWSTLPLTGGNYQRNNEPVWWSSREYTAQILREAAARGMRLDVFLFLSDREASAGVQNAPSAWRGLSVADTAVKVRDSAFETAQYFLSQGLNVEVYEIGNEIDFGILNFLANDRIPLPPGVAFDVTYMTQQVWPTEATLLKAAIAGIRAAQPKAKILLHIAGLEYSPANIRAKGFFKAMIDNGVEFDFAGVSLPYPGFPWRLDKYGATCWFQKLQETVDYIAELGKPTVLTEITYFAHPDPNASAPMPEFPYTPQGQASWLRETLRFAATNPNVAGVNYFYPDILPVPTGPGLFDVDDTPLPAVAEFARLAHALAPSTLAIEYYNAVFDHYFITPVAVEIGLLDAKTPPFQDWSRTGFAFNGYVNATAPAGSVAICRFFNSSFAPKSSHFYAPHGLGCEATLSTFPDWKLEDDKLFTAMLPDATGACPAGTIPVYRLYNNGMGGAPNHRFVTSLVERQKMVDKGYTPEGNGIGVGMCAPQ